MIFDRDPFARLALHPKFISPQTGAFDLAFLIKFSPLADGGIGMSVANRTELRDTSDVHDYGHRSASHANVDFVRREGRQPDDETERNHYLGFYDFEWASARLAPLTHHVVSIRWKPENGENAHFQVEVHPVRSTKPNSKQQRQDRIAMRQSLAMGFNGPVRHVAADNEAERQRLEEIAAQLPMMPINF